jgi:hypothetical protein
MITQSRNSPPFTEPEDSLPCSKSLPLVPILSQTNPVHTFWLYFPNIHCNIILTSKAGARIAQWYSSGLRARWSGIRVPAVTGNFSFHHRDQTGSGSHPVSYPMGIRDFSLGVKRPGREANHSPPPSAEVKNTWSYTSIPQYAFVAWCSIKAEGQLYLYLYLLLSKLMSSEWSPPVKFSDQCFRIHI